MFNSKFNELKEVKCFKKITDFKNHNVDYFQETKRLQSLQKAEAYLELKHASMVELGCEYI